ncbi:tRNA (guanosine(46)-N7)-methyltransferase TrmB [uncultured Porphyromonas sp.]|uniref:tRNA (guanosine(46)-N7)-methyltransferase TrmB n=1 Tax=uncultured Porphyromonas sp. TaxID=159274 RepID=UPI0025946A46|nr:tRNA (guanosine(46)-N7)-methyltransferase TrmB [uncultured Porphyromonas sp.]
MSKNKQTKFAELDALPNVLQYPYKVLKGLEGRFPYRGVWGTKVFGNDHPIIIELGCGRGEYTVELARNHPENNYIGIDIKGNRMWSGATTAHREGLGNVRFLRAEIESLTSFFGDGEVSELWLTFPDPQMRKVRKRLTSTHFLMQYKQILRSPKLLHLKTDSQFLFTYTSLVAKHNGLEVLECYKDIDEEVSETSDLRRIQTYYESQWRGRGISIKYLKIALDNLSHTPIEPTEEVPWDSYRSYGREARNTMNQTNQKI